jgi:uncharacterized protein (DUF2267 family)
MTEHTEPPREFPLRDTEAQIRSFLQELGDSEPLRSLGLAERAQEVAQAVLCSLWRNMPLSQLDIIRGLLPGGLDLMFMNCERPHHWRKPPDEYLQDSLLEDVSAHLQLPRDKALAACTAVFSVLRAHMPDEEVDDACRFISSADLKRLLRCPS